MGPTFLHWWGCIGLPTLIVLPWLAYIGGYIGESSLHSLHWWYYLGLPTLVGICLAYIGGKGLGLQPWTWQGSCLSVSTWSRTSQEKNCGCGPAYKLVYWAHENKDVLCGASGFSSGVCVCCCVCFCLCAKLMLEVCRGLVIWVPGSIMSIATWQRFGLIAAIAAATALMVLGKLLGDGPRWATSWHQYLFWGVGGGEGAWALVGWLFGLDNVGVGGGEGCLGMPAVIYRLGLFLL